MQPESFAKLVFKHILNLLSIGSYSTSRVLSIKVLRLFCPLEEPMFSLEYLSSFSSNKNYSFLTI